MALMKRESAMVALKKINKGVIAPEQLEEMDETALSLKLEALNKAFEKIEVHQDTLLDEAKSEAESEAHLEFHSVATDLFDETNLLLRRRLKELDRANAVETVSTPRSQSSQFGSRLPKVKVPPFDGSEENWLEFRDMYLAMVHNQDNLEPVCKLALLKEMVDPEKVTQVSGVYTGGYEEVWAQIRRRYDRPIRLVMAHTQRLLALPDQPRECQESLRHVIDQFGKYLRAMDNLKQPSVNPLLFPILFTKLPAEAVSYYHRQRRSDELPKVQDILDVLEDYSETVLPSEPRTMIQGHQRVRRVHKVEVARASSSCLHCGGPHALAKCNDLVNLSVSFRKQAVAATRACYKCLEAGHMCIQCPKPGCANCGANHHRLLCHANHGHRLPDGEQQVARGGGHQPQVMPRS